MSASVALLQAPVTPFSYLNDVITPAYKILADPLREQLSKVGDGPIDHSKLPNYDDFNEIFWQQGCLNLTIITMFNKPSPLKKRSVCLRRHGRTL